MRSLSWPTISIFWGRFGGGFAPTNKERQVGKTQGASLTPRPEICPPQGVENRKIKTVSLWPRIALFSAGNGLAEKGNTLGHLLHG
jgi:hypothetical protein